MTGALSQQMCWTWHTRDAATVRGPFPGSSTALATLSEPALKEEEEEEEEDEREEEEDVLTDATTGAQPSLEAACRMDRMLSSASTAAAAWLPQALDDTLWEEDDDEGFSGWTPWSPASFEMTENRSSGTPSTMTMRVGISSQ